MKLALPLAAATLVLLAARLDASPDGVPAPGTTTDFRTLSWQIDPRPVLPRGPAGSYDARVVGDPCVVWDEDLNTWRMFYFASGSDPATGARGPRTAMALGTGAEKIGPGDWRKIGLVTFENPTALLNRDDFHKWWVVLDAGRPNRAARIDGRFWAVFAASKRLADGRMHKHIQAASASRLAGPWRVVEEPVIAPGPGGLDALHADTPAAFWFEDKQRIGIFYKGYPLEPQSDQPGSPFGSGMMLAAWYPDEAHARKAGVMLRPGQNGAWNRGWMSSIQLFREPGSRRWYGLHNGSPTPPLDDSHREPAPSLGGWLVCDGDPLAGRWRSDERKSPFVLPENLSAAERAAGLGANFWRHHLLVTPQGKVRIFFNSGTYGTEQMYSLVPR